MTSKVNLKADFFSCKLGRPETLKSHRDLQAAKKAAGDHGFIYSRVSDMLSQCFQMADNSISAYNLEQSPSRLRQCNSGDFNWGAVLAEAGVIPRRLYHYASPEVRKNIAATGLDPAFDRTGMAAVFVTNLLCVPRGSDVWLILPEGVPGEKELVPDHAGEPAIGEAWYSVHRVIPAAHIKLLWPAEKG